METDKKIGDEDQKITEYREIYCRPYLTLQEIYFLINVCVATRKIKKITLPHMTLRPQTHLMLVGIPGGAKSTILYQVCSELKTMPYAKVSAAMLTGTIEKDTKQLMIPITYQQKNSILAVDEMSFSKDNGENISQLLHLLENSEYKRPFPFKAYDTEKRKDGDLYCYVDKDNNICVKTRFCMMATTMANLYFHKKSVMKTAVKGRFLLLPVYPSKEELKLMARGKLRFRFKDYGVKPEVKISKKNYSKILEFADGLFDKDELKEEYYLRTIGDLCRIFAVVRFDKIAFSLIKKIRTFNYAETN